MSAKPPAEAIMDREFLAMRCRLIDLAAGLDRIDRAEGDLSADPRLTQIRHALQILADKKPNRAEQVQMAFSLKEK